MRLNEDVLAIGFDNGAFVKLSSLDVLRREDDKRRGFESLRGTKGGAGYI